VIALRKQNYSVYDIQRILRAEDQPLSHAVISQLLKEEGFAKLPRRRNEERPDIIRSDHTQIADVRQLNWEDFRSFETQAGALFVFVPTLVTWHFERWVQRARLPGSQMIPALSSLLALLSLKLVSTERISHVSDVCTDPGFALFCALNVMPKTFALSTYSYRITGQMTAALLDHYHRTLTESGLLRGQCFNLDFHAIPQRGEEAVLEKHYVSKRSRRERSVLVFLVQDSDSQVLCYSDATVRKDDQAEQILQFAEFWRRRHGQYPSWLIFDSQLTTYPVLDQLDERAIRFITLRRRGKDLLRSLSAIDPKQWKCLRLRGTRRRFRNVRCYESKVKLRGVTTPLRQLAVAGLGHEEPTLFLTNDPDIKPLDLVERYAHRMLIENAIAENVDFFHLDALGSAIALQVDIDLMLTLIANALYRNLAGQLRGHESERPKQIFRHFLNTPARVTVTDDEVCVRLRRRTHHPLLLDSGVLDATPSVPWWEGRRLRLSVW
jgi:hypothetical protein